MLPRRRRAAIGAAVLVVAALAIVLFANSGESSHAQPDPGPLVAEAAQRVVAHASALNPDGGLQKQALVATAYVAAHVRPEMLRARERSGLRAPTNAEEALQFGAGICGNATETLIAILDRLHIPARPVQFFFGLDGRRDSHVGVEAHWNGSWHYLDPTYGKAFVRGSNVLPIAEVLHLSHPAGIERDLSQAPPPPGIHDIGEFLADGRNMTVAVPPAAKLRPAARPAPDGSVKFVLWQFSNSIGAVSSYGGVPMTYDWRLATDGRRRLSLDTTTTSCGPGGRLRATAADGREASIRVDRLRKSGSTFRIPRAPQLDVSVGQPGAGCFILIDALSAS